MPSTVKRLLMAIVLSCDRVSPCVVRLVRTDHARRGGVLVIFWFRSLLGTGTAICSVTLTPIRYRICESTMMRMIRYRNMSTGCGTLLPSFSMPSSMLLCERLLPLGAVAIMRAAWSPPVLMSVADLPQLLQNGHQSLLGNSLRNSVSRRTPTPVPPWYRRASPGGRPRPCRRCRGGRKG